MVKNIIATMLKNSQMKSLFLDIEEMKKMILEINSPVLPKVLLGNITKQQTICLLSPSTLFSHDTLVSLYTYQNGFEELIAIGKVLVIQDNKNIQIVIQKKITEKQEIIDGIINNNPIILKTILVKPNVPQSYIQYLTQGDGMK